MRRLLIRPGALGDCILSLPALEYLVADYTEIWIPSPVVPLVRFADSVRPLLSTGIDKAAIDDSELPPELSAKLASFDSIVSWYGSNRPQFREALMGVGTNCTFHAALPGDDCKQHATDFFAEQVGAPLGNAARIEVESGVRRGSIAIHPYSGSKRKNWPLTEYAQLASRLPGPVEWTAGPEEVLEGAFRFENLAALSIWLRGASLYIGNDSGVTHLAAAIGLPTIAIFIDTRAEVWAPRGDRVIVLKNPTVEAVADAANRLLG